VSKPQVLVFIDWYKPYYKAGGPVRSMVNLVEHLSDRIDFHIVTSDRDYMATSNEANVQVDSWVRGDAGERVRYCSPERHTRSAWKTILNERKYDVIYINGLYSRWSTIMPLWILRGSEQRRIVAIRGMLAAGPMKQSALKKRIFLTTMKAFGCFEGVEYQATNTEEVQDIKRWIGPDVKVHLVQNLARKAAHSEPPVIEKVSGELLLVSLARIAEEKNTLFAIERLAQLKGKVRFDLYGTVYNAAYYDQCKKAIANLPPGIEVHWHGQLPQEEGTTVLAAAHALYMPSVGENFGHTMLESLSVGRPLVISDRTPWKGLQKASAGWDLPLEDPALFVKALQGLVDMDQLAYDRLAEGAFTLGARYLADPAPVERSLAMFRS